MSNAGNAIEAGGIAAEADGGDTAYAITQGIIVQGNNFWQTPQTAAIVYLLADFLELRLEI